MYIAAIAGPIELPIILISIFIPKEIPILCLGVARVTTFIAPTFIKDIPADTIARFAETVNYCTVLEACLRESKTNLKIAELYVEIL
jgi:hypothetical protein